MTAQTVNPAQGVVSGPAAISTAVREVFGQLDRLRIDYVVPRNYSNLPDRIGNDIDLLVSPEHLTRMRAALTLVLRGHGAEVRQAPVGSSGIKVVASWPVDVGDRGPQVSFHLQAWIPFEITNTQRLVPGLSRKVFLGDIRNRQTLVHGCRLSVPDPVDEFLLLVRQYFFKPKPSYSKRLCELAALEPVTAFIRVTAAESLTGSFVSGTVPRAHLGTLKRMVERRWGRPGVGGSVRMYLRAAMATLRLRGLRLPPSIYLAGPDGAGKTTIAAAIRRTLEDAGVPCRHFYSMKKNLLRDAALQIGKALPFLRGGGHGPRRFRWFLADDIEDRDTGRAMWRVRKFVRLCFGIVDVGLCYLATLWFRARGYTLIIETSPYDLFVKYHMPKFDRLERLVCPLLPRPRVGLILRADPQAIHQRKTELTVEEIAAYYRRMDDILREARVADRFTNVPAGMGITVARERATQCVLEAL